MTFVGIVIFTVYTTVTVWPMGGCDPQWSSKTICADYASAPIQKEEGEPRAVYVGEFDSIDACDAAIRKLTYKTKKNERVDPLSGSLCVPKVMPQ